MSAVLQAFGVIGILSVLLWAGALGLCLMSVRRRAWFPWAVRAVACALLALGVAKWNSVRVSAIEVDRSDLVREALARHREAQIRDGEAVDAPRFAETSAADALAQAGSLSETGVAEPAYRRRGKQQRLLENGTAAGPVAGGDPTAGVGESGEADEPGVRRMKQEAVDRANRWDRWNLFAARSTVWIALLGLVGLWVRRFHRLPGSGPALPLAAPWLDAFSPRDMVVALPGGEAEMQWFVEHAVRKGERVLVLGGASHPDGTALRKLGVGDSAEVAVRWAGPIAGARDLSSRSGTGWSSGRCPTLPRRPSRIGCASGARFSRCGCSPAPARGRRSMWWFARKRPTGIRGSSSGSRRARRSSICGSCLPGRCARVGPMSATSMRMPSWNRGFPRRKP